jgi:hypothetical protein
LGARTRAATNAIAARTAVATKLALQLNHSRISPQVNIPRIAPELAKPAQTLTARLRLEAGNTAVIVDRVPGMIIAAPTPITTRQPMSAPGDSAAAAQSAASPNTTVPARSSVRRPRRSPRAPNGSTRAASATV